MRTFLGAVLALSLTPVAANAAAYSIYEYTTPYANHPSTQVTRNIAFGTPFTLQYSTRFYEIVPDSGVRVRNSFAGTAADTSDACARPYVAFSRQVGTDQSGSIRPIVITTLADTACVAAFDGPAPVPTTASAFTGSGTANTFTQALPANTSRRDCSIYSPSAFSIAPGASPAANIAIAIPAGGTFKCSSAAVTMTDALSVASATASAAYVIWTQ